MSRSRQLSNAAEKRFWLGVEAAGRFFMGEADVLPRTLVDELNSFVRDKYLELWKAVQDHPEE